MSFSIPSDTVTRTISVDFSERSLKVTVGTETLAKGELHAPIRPDESFWQIDRGEGSLVLHMDKRDDMSWWSCVLRGAPEVDIQAIEPGNSKLDDLDGETRGMVEKMMYDQRQKAAGKPTSDEQQKLKMFEKFKKEHPEMDFSNVQSIQ